VTDEQTQDDEAQVRPFAEFLVMQGRGATHDELSLRLHELVAAVQETGKAGKLQLTIEVKPLSKGDTHTLSVTDTIAAKMPAGERPVTVFFTDKDGNLTRDDPRQMRLPLREAEDRRKEPKEVAR